MLKCQLTFVFLFVVVVGFYVVGDLLHVAVDYANFLLHLHFSIIFEVLSAVILQKISNALYTMSVLKS
jgi:hypothetical protein